MWSNIGRDPVVVSLLILLVMIASVMSIPVACANNAGQAHPVKGKIVEMSKNLVKVIIDGHEYTIIMRSPPTSKKLLSERFFLVRVGNVTKGVSKARDVQVYVASKPSGSKFDEITVIEPDVLKANIPISGTLQPRHYDKYGTYTSVVVIDVSVQWTPGSEILGIAILDVNTGTGYGYWYTGGSADASFGTTLGHSYRILILSYAGNTQVIHYDGTITLYIY